MLLGCGGHGELIGGEMDMAQRDADHLIAAANEIPDREDNRGLCGAARYKDSTTLPTLVPWSL